MTVTNEERIRRKSPNKSIPGERYEIRTICQSCGDVIIQYDTVGTDFQGRLRRCYLCTEVLWRKHKTEMRESGIPRYLWIDYLTKPRLGGSCASH